MGVTSARKNLLQMADIKAGSHDLLELIWSKSPRFPVDQPEFFIGTTVLVNVLSASFCLPFSLHWMQRSTFFFILMVFLLIDFV